MHGSQRIGIDNEDNEYNENPSIISDIMHSFYLHSPSFSNCVQPKYFEKEKNTHPTSITKIR